MKFSYTNLEFKNKLAVAYAAFFSSVVAVLELCAPRYRVAVPYIAPITAQILYLSG